MENIKIQFLDSFFNLFEANVSIIKIQYDVEFYGVVKWNDGETQDFKWVNIFNDKSLKALKDICSFISENKLNHNDKILISETELRFLLGKKWTKNKIELAIESLMSLSVKMIDDGEETDSFFMHF